MKPKSKPREGITPYKSKFRVDTVKESVSYYIGLFDTKDEATKAYDAYLTKNNAPKRR